MSIDPRYVAAADLQQYLVDKSGSGALAGGLVYFYQDTSRTTLQNVYEITGNAPNYSFSPLPNPVILSSVGTFMDNDGNDIIPYYLPWLIVNGEITNTPSLYYVVVQNSAFIPQFTREAWPPNSFVSSGDIPVPGIQSDINYIPNGQFLIHNNIPNNGLITQPSTILAPGGWVFNIESAVASTNLVTFEAVGSWTNDPPESPEYKINIQCTDADTSETYKALSCEFNDVNKFANGNAYSFGFWAVSTSGNVNVSINVNKNFGGGGSSFVPLFQAEKTITGNAEFFSVPINFETNAGDTIGTPPTTISVDVSFSTGVTFNVEMTDFVLVAGSVTLSDFPVQTNADMITRSVNGWTNIPDYNGLDLYLPAVLTSGGMQYDHSIIGKIQAAAGKVAHPGDALTATPPPIGNDMPCDGSTYIYANYSTLGIPYSRLGAYLISNSAMSGIPMYGTGTNFATAYADAGNTSSFRLTVNSAGTGVAIASDVSSGITFSVIPTYNGSATGSASINFTAYNNVANTILVVGNFTTPDAAISDGSGGNATGFTFVTLNNQTGLLAQQFYAVTILTGSASTLARTGLSAKYFEISNATTTYYVWFRLTNETDPAPGGGAIGIQVNLQSTDTAQDVANILREVLNAYQITLAVVSAAPTEGSYFDFQTNPASTINYLVWYSYLADSTPPVVAGRILIKVLLSGTPTPPQVVTATINAVNQYQYAAPNFQGMFLRGTDFAGVWDKDVAQRWSTVSGISGANYGTFEYQQLLNHLHIDGTSGTGINPTGGGVGAVNTQATGGSETRPVNACVNYVIKY
jgi:hypothetical protein